MAQVSVNGYLDYTTRSGDTYDMMAIAAYNDEKMASVIIQANPMLAGVLVFDAGTKLKIPIINKRSAPSTLPPWRR